MSTIAAAASFTAPDVVQIRLELGRVEDGRQTTVIPPGYEPDPDHGYIWADGGWAGRIGGRSNEYFMPFDTFTPSPIDDLFDVRAVNGVLRAQADDKARWIVEVDGVRVPVQSVSRKSHILDSGEVGWGEWAFETLENVYLDLARPIPDGASVSVRFADPDFAAVETVYNPFEVISEAVHVNLRGFDPDDAAKTAYLSSWNGWRVDGRLADYGVGVGQGYAPGTAFDVIDEATGRVAYSGLIELSRGADEPTDFALNYQGTDVWRMDFGDLDDPGRYHIVVDGVGRSQSFEIADDHWGDVFDVSFSGFYHQRSGLALEEAHTDWTRPRSLHPEDGVVVRGTTVSIADTTMGYKYDGPDPFDLFADRLTGEVFEDAWGGWHDAGDWDRRTQHHEAARKLIELVEMNPDWAEGRAASIPEAGNGAPDLLDEALWHLDLFRRLQNDDGGVSGGIESAAHPNFGEGSWGESLEVYAYAADPWSSWEYASTAAKMAGALAPYDAARAAAFRESAVAAMTWAEAARPTGADYDAVLNVSRNLAAAELFRLTGDDRWHDVFKESWVYAPGAGDVPWNGHQYEAAFVYARTEGAEDAFRDAGVAAILDQAEYLARFADRSGFEFAADPYAPYGWGNTGQAPTSAALFAKAHALTGDARWLGEIQEDAQYTLGANPYNMAFMTGLGVREPQSVLNVDAETLGEGPPPGITIYGDYDIRDYGYGFYHGQMEDSVWPNFYETPVAESFNAFYLFVPSTEYTVQQGIADMTYAAGYLAATVGADGGGQAGDGEGEPVGSIETGSLRFKQAGPNAWTRVEFDGPIEDAVVIVSPATNKGWQEGAIRVRDVSETGFELQYDEWDYHDGRHVAEEVSWLALSAGAYELADGRTLVAGSTGGGGARTAVDLAGFDAAPVVLAQVASAESAEAVTHRISNVEADRFVFRLQEEERSDGVRTDETLSWLAVEEGSGAGFDASFLRGVNGKGKTVDADAGDHLFADMQTEFGPDTGVVRFDPLTGGETRVYVEEERSRDQETAHAKERVGVIRIEEDVIELF